ncbi:MAG: class F sortase, partial [Isosphaeraceae bacterium]
MVGTWSSMLRRARPPARLMAEVILGVVLVAAVAFTPRDAVPAQNTDSLIGPNVHFTVAPEQQTRFGLALPGLNSLSSWASTSGALVSEQALIPTAPPAQLLIPELNVHRAVEAVGTNRFGVMNLPSNGWNAGWYKAGPTPGAPGDAVIEGHAGFPDQPMIFGKLSTLRSGDQVVVVLKDGSKRLFLVVSKATFPVGSAPAGMGLPYGPPRLTLVTCAGSFDASTYSYSRRL